MQNKISTFGIPKNKNKMRKYRFKPGETVTVSGNCYIHRLRGRSGTIVQDIGGNEFLVEFIDLDPDSPTDLEHWEISALHLRPANIPLMKNPTLPPPDKVDNILQKASEIVFERSDEKERQYGPFIECNERIAEIARVLCQKEITTEDIYKIQIAIKLGRESFNHKQDNLLDAAAYIGALDDFYNRNENI